MEMDLLLQAGQALLPPHSAQDWVASEAEQAPCLAAEAEARRLEHLEAYPGSMGQDVHTVGTHLEVDNSLASTHG
jgi:hypothetical protein